MTRRLVHHTPVWEPAQLRVDAAGNTKPGFVCAHPLENGNGPCEGNVFRVEDGVGDHACVVDDEAATEPAR
jgi:hypothetical protein